MGPSLIPVLLLATVALSSSNVLPVSVNHLSRDSLGLDGQYNDNTYSNRQQTKNVLDKIYKLYVTQDNKPILSKMQQMYPDNNRDEDVISIFNKNDNYNGEGFRKEQWHNYPRQLDRLHQFYDENDVKRNYSPDLNKEQYPEEIPTDENDINDITNEFQVGTGTNNIYDAVIAANPLLILKIRLACLNKDVDNANTQYANVFSCELENALREDDKNEEFRNENPAENIMKVKREGVSSTQDNELSENPSTENKAVSKRIFSLWSRLQSLNHKGHELQHRRHLHAFYGLPDSDGGGALTAETRATLMRPPGSPLRWG